MTEVASILATVPIFEGLTADQLAVMERISKQKRCQKGEVIIREGEQGDVMYVLTKGNVEVSRTVTLSLSSSKVGEAEKSFSKLEASDHPAFGEMALLEKSLRGATITALTDCEFLEISGASFDRVCREDPVLGYKVIRNIACQLSTRLRRTNQDVLKLSSALSLALGRR